MSNIIFDLAIVGGMGPEATNLLFGRILKLTMATKDQEHLTIIIFNLSTMPDRSISETPKNEIEFIINLILNSNAKYAVIACNSFHRFASHFQHQSFMLIDMITSTTNYIRRLSLDKIMLLASSVTVNQNLYMKSDSNLMSELFYPRIEMQNMIDGVIKKVKDTSSRNLTSLAIDLLNIMDKTGFDHFLVSCTELSLLTEELRSLSNYTIIDSLDVAAIESIISVNSEKLNIVEARKLLPHFTI